MKSCFPFGISAVLLALLTPPASAPAQNPPEPAQVEEKAPTPKPRPPRPKVHQATGVVTALTDNSIVILKQRGKGAGTWKFERTSETRTTGTLKRAAKVTVYYSTENGKKIAQRIKVLDASTSVPASTTPSRPAKSTSAPPH